MAASLNGDYSRVVPLISSFYTVKDYQTTARDDGVEFLIAESDIYKTFPVFLKELAKLNMIALAKRSKYVSRIMPTLSSVKMSVDGGVVIFVTKMPRQKPKAKRLVPIPVLLFIATIVVVFIDGIYRSQSALAKAYIQDPLMLAAIFTVSLMGILGIHELGHMFAARKHGIKASWPYFIPGIPGFLVPTFGAMIQIRSSMTNRNILFDVGVAGPIAGLIITIIVSIYGSSISSLISMDEARALSNSGQLESLNPLLNPSLLMMATWQLMNIDIEGQVLVVSPVLYAALVGYLITFLNLMPAWQLDGGHLARSALGVHWHRILTYVSIGVLFALQYWFMALLVLFFSTRAPESTPLDDVSPLSRNRKALFVLALGLAVLCAPIPQYLLG